MNWISNLWYWKLAITRCIIYGLIVSWTMFKAGTNGFESLSDMKPLQLCQLFGDMLFGGFLGVILAFLDNTLQSKTNGKTNGNFQPQPQPQPPVVKTP